MISEDAIRHEAAAVYRFIEPLVRMCGNISEYPVYTHPARKFFTYVRSLGEKTQKFLAEFPRELSKNKKTAFSKRKKLLELRNGWETIHEYLKPALDADTLHVPAPLMLTLQDMVEDLPNLKGIEFTVFHTSEVNYLQIPAETFREIANGVADAIKAEHFPDDQGLIGMPYSQASGFFLNCLLPHEMGHFVYQEVFLDEIERQIDTELEKLESANRLLDEQDITACRDMLAQWVEEIFCDLFAISLIGPAYSFALIELTGAMLLLGQPASRLSDFHFFIEDHPAEISRFDAHVRLLKQLKWWDQVEEITCAAVEVLRVATAWRGNVHIQAILPEAVTEIEMLGCYEGVIKWLIGYVRTKVRSNPADITAFRDESPIIAEYLRRAIVPSTIVVDRVRRNPTAVVLLNAGFRFYLESLNDLLVNTGADHLSVEARSRLTERLELWVLKAVEDNRLLQNQLPDGSHS